MSLHSSALFRLPHHSGGDSPGSPHFGQWSLPSGIGISGIGISGRGETTIKEVNTEIIEWASNWWSDNFLLTFVEKFKTIALEILDKQQN